MYNQLNEINYSIGHLRHIVDFLDYHYENVSKDNTEIYVLSRLEDELNEAIMFLEVLKKFNDND